MADWIYSFRFTSGPSVKLNIGLITCNTAVRLVKTLRSCSCSGRFGLNTGDFQQDVYTSLVSTCKAMGGGWIVKAEAVANQTDFPPPEEDQPSSFALPRPTPPPALETTGPDKGQ